MANTRAVCTPAPTPPRRLRLATEDTEIVVLHTEEKQGSHDQGFEDTMSVGADSGLPVMKKPSLAIKFSTKILEKRYNQFNIGHRNIVFGKTVTGDD